VRTRRENGRARERRQECSGNAEVSVVARYFSAASLKMSRSDELRVGVVRGITNRCRVRVGR